MARTTPGLAPFSSRRLATASRPVRASGAFAVGVAALTAGLRAFFAVLGLPVVIDVDHAAADPGGGEGVEAEAERELVLDAGARRGREDSAIAVGEDVRGHVGGVAAGLDD